MRWLLSVLLVAWATLAGCNQNRPLAAHDARSAAENLCLRERLDWGDAIETLAPGPVPGRHDAWQVAFAPAHDGSPRVVLVDGVTGWAALPPPGYEIRRQPRGEPAAAPAATAVVDGPWILVVEEPVPGLEAAAIGRLTREATRLNDLATRTGLWPLFSVHTDRAGRTGLAYGWQGDRGIARDDSVADWARHRGGLPAVRWVDLTPK